MARFITTLACKAILRNKATSSTYLLVQKSLKANTKPDQSRVFARSTGSARVKPFSHSLQVRYFTNTLDGKLDAPGVKSLDSEVKKVDETFRRVQWFYKLPQDRRQVSIPELLIDVEDLTKSPIFNQFKAFIYQPLMAVCVGCIEELENGLNDPAWQRFEKRMQDTKETKQFLGEVRALSEEVKKDRIARNTPSDPINFDNLKFHPHVRAHFHRGLFYFTGEPVHLSRMVQAYHLAAIGTEDRDECVKYMQDCSVALSTIMIYNPQTAHMFMNIGKSQELEQTIAPMIFDIVGRLDAQFSKNNTNNKQ